MSGMLATVLVTAFLSIQEWGIKVSGFKERFVFLAVESFLQPGQVTLPKSSMPSFLMGLGFKVQ